MQTLIRRWEVIGDRALPGLAGLLVALVLAGCGSHQTASSVQPASSAPASGTIAGPVPTTVKQICDEQTWPRQVPAVVGVILDDAGPLLCWDSVKGNAPDGRDVYNTPGTDKGVVWLITDISPPSGTPIGRGDTITVHVVPEALPAAQRAFYPCNWVTTDEAARFFGASSATADPTGDETGSAQPFCSYNSPSHFVTSELALPPSFVIDARTQLDMWAASSHASEVNGLPGRAFCSTSEHDGKKSTQLEVLLSGDRLYQAIGWDGESCDILNQFAQTAISRV